MFMINIYCFNIIKVQSETGKWFLVLNRGYNVLWSSKGLNATHKKKYSFKIHEKT